MKYGMLALAALLLGPGAAQAEIVRYPIPNSTFPIAQAVKVSGDAVIIYLSGQVPPMINKDADPASPQAYGDIKTQTVGVLNRIKTILEGQGLGMGDVIKMQVFLVHDARAPMDFKAFMEGYTQFFGGAQPNLPVRSVVGVAALANPGFLVEIEVVAAKLEITLGKFNRRIDQMRQNFGFNSVRRSSRLALLGAALMAASATSAFAANEGLTPNQQRAFDIYKELVEIDTVTATGDTAKAAEAMAARLRAAGFPEADVHAFSPAPHKGNLVARLHGSGARKPILLVAHLDVVPASREDWSTDPFKLIEQDGYFYARGSGDDKYMAASHIANLIRYRQEGYKPDRDIIVALETDEETLDKDALGIQWLLKNHRDLIDAEFALNEGGGVGLKGGKPYRNSVQTSEKVSVSYALTVKNKGGHSSVPVKDNAIYHLAAGLTRLSAFSFPVNLNETTRAYFERTAQMMGGQTADDLRAVLSGQTDPTSLPVVRLSADAGFNAQLRTTCVATMLEGGVAVNALPPLATAKVNCRIMPGEPVDGVKAALERVLADDQIAVAQIDRPTLSEPSALREDVVGPIAKLSAEFWPGAVVLPTMSAGATDGSYLRNAGIPTYGHSGLASDIAENRAHGRDERIQVKSFYEGNEYLYRLVKVLAGGK